MSTCHNCGLPIENSSACDVTHSLCKSCEDLCEKKNSLRISPLGQEDLELVLAWRSNPNVYRYFRNQNDALGWDDHVSWYRSRHSDRHDFVLHYDGRRVGVVSITATDKASIYLGDFSAHGQGVATAALKWLCDRFEDRTPLFAEIHEENTSSKPLFERCGFQQHRYDGKWLEYVYDP